MNFIVLILAACGGLLVGGLAYFVYRIRWGFFVLPPTLVGFVALILPWDAAPSPGPRPSSERQTSENENLPTLMALRSNGPIEVKSHGYVASDACRECHAENHASWFASYHRTMTQEATPDAVLGDFDGVSLSQHGRVYHLEKHRGVCWVDMPDPTAIPGTPAASRRIKSPILMTTGSHHMQAYWFPMGVGRTTGILPFVFLNETQEWIPRAAAFLKPNSTDSWHEIGRWNKECSKCHSTHPRQREVSPGEFDTYAAEFGISCEACHGPGTDHIQYHRDLVAGNEEDRKSDPIVNPDNLTHVRSSQVCGQCHSVMTVKGDRNKLNVEGHAYRPGTDLDESHQIWRLDSPEMEEVLADESFRETAMEANRGTFYLDGTVRVSGREFSCMSQSACYQRGTMSCLSCHQLHQADDDPRPAKEWANDQLRPSAKTDAACTQCHDASQYAEKHTHHAANSMGSRCYNCHMPHTAYGLLGAIRNHTISSPNVADELAARRPGACNQCHLDQTLQWTADHLESWYAIEPPELESDHREIAAALVWMIRGDAGERAMAAWTMGWADALQTSGDQWQSLFLAQLLNDPYLAVRFVARRSIRRLPGLESISIRPMGTDEDRRKAIESIVDHWKSTPQTSNKELLIGERNSLDLKRLQELLSRRDETPIKLAE